MSLIILFVSKNKQKNFFIKSQMDKQANRMDRVSSLWQATLKFKLINTDNRLSGSDT